jgi:hypothetical protein
MTKANYQRHELLDLIEEQYKGDYPSMSGSFAGTLASVLIQVEVRNPELFQKIMEFEIGTRRRIMENSND